MIKMYKVGGCVRDELLGIQSKDIDFSVEAPSFQAMKQEILEMGGKIHDVPGAEANFTIRAKVPGIGDADFVLCRKDGHYSDGRRPDTVEMGTLMDDLARRDFTINAMAMSKYGELIDPFGGKADLLDNKLIRCVGSTDRLREDSLRMIRALRFSLTKNLKISPDAYDMIRNSADLLKNVSLDRIRDEFLIMFWHSTVKTLHMLYNYPEVIRVVFNEMGLKLRPSTKKKRGRLCKA